MSSEVEKSWIEERTGGESDLQFVRVALECFVRFTKGRNSGATIQTTVISDHRLCVRTFQDDRPIREFDIEFTHLRAAPPAPPPKS